MIALVEILVSNAALATALALVAYAVGRLARRPALAHGLWVLVLLKLVTPPLWRVPLITLADPVTAPPVAATAPEPHPPVAPQVLEMRFASSVAIIALPTRVGAVLPERTAPAEPAAAPAPTRSGDGALPLGLILAVALWGLGVAAVAGLALRRARRFRTLLAHAHPADPALARRARELGRHLGLVRCPRVDLLPARISPMLWGLLGRVRILLPASLARRVDAARLDALLAHELAHYRRGDHRVRLLEILATALYWWFPLLWFARRHLHEVEEQSCDALVLSIWPQRSGVYATALLDTIDYLAGAATALPPAASGMGQTRNLKRRVAMIMDDSAKTRLGWGGRLAIAALAAALLPVLPIQAQREVDVRPGKGRVTVTRRAGPQDEALRQQVKALKKAAAELQRSIERLEKRLAQPRGRDAVVELKAVRELSRARKPAPQAPKVRQRILRTGAGRYLKLSDKVPAGQQGHFVWKTQRAPAPEKKHDFFVQQAPGKAGGQCQCQGKGQCQCKGGGKGKCSCGGACAPGAKGSAPAPPHAGIGIWQAKAGKGGLWHLEALGGDKGPHAPHAQEMEIEVLKDGKKGCMIVIGGPKGKGMHILGPKVLKIGEAGGDLGKILGEGIEGAIGESIEEALEEALEKHGSGAHKVMIRKRFEVEKDKAEKKEKKEKHEKRAKKSSRKRIRIDL